MNGGTATQQRALAGWAQCVEAGGRDERWGATGVFVPPPTALPCLPVASTAFDRAGKSGSAPAPRVLASKNSRVAPALLTLRAAPAASAGNVQAASAASSKRACGRSWGPFLARELALTPGRPPGMSRGCSRLVNGRCNAAGVGWRLSLLETRGQGWAACCRPAWRSIALCSG